jgi:hypothetical protein
MGSTFLIVTAVAAQKAGWRAGLIGLRATEILRWRYPDST